MDAEKLIKAYRAARYSMRCAIRTGNSEIYTFRDREIRELERVAAKYNITLPNDE